MADCYILKSHLVSAPCCRCKNEALPAHNVGMELFCGACCPIHGSQASAEWIGEAKTISGEQPCLFEKEPVE